MKILFINPGYSFEELFGDLAKAGNELPPQNIAGLAAVTRNLTILRKLLVSFIAFMVFLFSNKKQKSTE